ncbi:hypothetical protein [Streptomyces sp. NPDC048473]|uniref:aromatic-ring hydroxylase C-terminal domain-containing protein n=1 Tax=unclassified Streptomyces TaxID=2593676 RepID=UPI003719F05A
MPRTPSARRAPGTDRTGRGSSCRRPLTAADGTTTDVTGLLTAGRPLLLLTPGRAAPYAEQAAGWAHVVRTVTAAPPRPLPWDAALLRPDGYIAWASDGGSLDGALRQWFGEPR